MNSLTEQRTNFSRTILITLHYFMTTSWSGVKYSEMKITIQLIPWFDRWHALRLWKNADVPRASATVSIKNNNNKKKKQKKKHKEAV